MTTTELFTGLLATLCQAGHFDSNLNIWNLGSEQGYHERCCVFLKQKQNCAGFGQDRVNFLHSSCMGLCFGFVLKTVLIIQG